MKLSQRPVIPVIYCVIELAGGQAAVAKAFGLNQSSVFAYTRRGMPADEFRRPRLSFSLCELANAAAKEQGLDVRFTSPDLLWPDESRHNEWAKQRLKGKGEA